MSTRKTGIGICLAHLLFLSFPHTALAGVTPELQQAIRENTFEVVKKKPEKDPVSYEKPLPLELVQAAIHKVGRVERYDLEDY
jgi:hypothetical protein